MQRIRTDSNTCETAFYPSAGNTSHKLVAFTDVEVDVPGHGLLKVDIGYGGAFYALVPAHSLGLDVTKCRTRDLTDAASLVTGGVAVMLL